MTPTDRSAWEAGPPTREHTFETGRSAVLLERLPVSRLVRTGVLAGDLVEAWNATAAGLPIGDAALAQRLEDVIVTAMWVDPPVTLDDDADAVPIAMLDQIEVTETVTIALGGARLAEAFRAGRRALAGLSRGDAMADTAEQDPA